MALSDLLHITSRDKKKVVEIDKNKIRDTLPYYQDLISYWRVYPDKFVDYLCDLNPENKFKLYFTQRLYLRLVMRYRNLYAVFSRGFSKSFLAVLGLMLKAILYPRATLITVAEAKNQSSMILTSKVNELCGLIPALRNEIQWDTKGQVAKTQQSKDEISIVFKNGSIIKNIAMTQSSRGARAQGVLTEEVATIVDQGKYEEIVSPMLVISRKINGQVDPQEVLNQNAIYVTSAGYKGTYAYDKLIDCLCHMVADDEFESFIIGGDWKIPVIEGLQPVNFIQNQELGNSMDASGFEREYGSLWSGTLDGAFFDINKFDKHRVLNIAEKQYNNGLNKEHGYYLLGVDVGRLGCTTEVVVIKVKPQPTGVDKKDIVNIFTFEEEHFGMQAIRIKRIFNAFKCSMCVVDANGLGVGLVDYMIVDQVDPDTGQDLPNLGIYNLDDMDDKTRKNYKSFENENTIKNAMYLMKANTPLNSEMYSYCQTQLQNGKIDFLLDSGIAKNKLLAQSQGKKMNAIQRADHLRPFVETDILKSQMANLIQENEGATIILKQSSRKILKDKVSALIYGLYWCKLQEEKRARRKGRNISDFMFFTKKS